MAQKSPNKNQHLQNAFDLFNDITEIKPNECSNILLNPVEKTNLSTISTIAQPTTTIPSQQMKNTTPITQCKTKELEKNRRPDIWIEQPPVYMGPVVLKNIPNMGRGYVAEKDIPAGTLLFIENVYVKWPSMEKNEMLFINTLRMILRSEERDVILCNLSQLHPSSFDDVPSELVATAREKYGQQLETIRSEFPELQLSFDFLLQKLLGMQCSAFSSGIFLHLSIYNHSCQPNCVKFSPVDGYSEVRSSSFIKKGDQLTISYLSPPEQFQHLRQQQFTKQFGFSCMCPLCSQTEPYLEVFDTIEEKITSAEYYLKASKSEQALQLGLDGMSDALEVLSPQHLVFIRFHKIIVEACSNLLENENNFENATVFLRSVLELYDIQKLFLNPDHIDIATTCHDASQGIQLILSLNLKLEAFQHQFPEFKSFRHASQQENFFRKEHLRIKNLYE